MSGQSGKKSGKVGWLVLIIALIAGALYAVNTVYGLNEFYESVSDGKIPESLSKKAAAAKKHGKPGAGDGVVKSVKDVLGGPAFSGGKAAIQQVALRGGDPEPIVKTSLSTQPSQSEEADAAPTVTPSPMPLPPPPRQRRALPSFPKTNAPTLNFTLETPPPPTAQPEPVKAAAAPLPKKTEPAKAAAAQPPKKPEPAQAAAPPPPPPKPRATLVLSNVNGHLSDRKDINVSMSVELTYEVSNALREEVEFKRDMLTTVAGSVLRQHEYGTINTATLKTDIITALNNQLRAGKLSSVEIRDLHIGQVATK
jgi:flagellar basal body-associated protein FliL